MDRQTTRQIDNKYIYRQTEDRQINQPGGVVGKAWRELETVGRAALNQNRFLPHHTATLHSTSVQHLIYIKHILYKYMAEQACMGICKVKIKDIPWCQDYQLYVIILVGIAKQQFSLMSFEKKVLLICFFVSFVFKVFNHSKKKWPSQRYDKTRDNWPALVNDPRP